jgi:hypothetical protein
MQIESIYEAQCEFLEIFDFSDFLGFSDHCGARNTRFSEMTKEILIACPKYHVLYAKITEVLLCHFDQ